MNQFPSFGMGRTGTLLSAGLSVFLLGGSVILATDWPQYRGLNTDGISPELISTNWPPNGPAVVWRNGSLTNGFSCLAVSQGRAFTIISRDNGSAARQEYCVAVDAASGTNVWATPIDIAPWDPTYTGDGGSGSAPYYTGDGPRTTPSVSGNRVITLSHDLHLVCMSTTDGAVLWSNNLVAAFGASTIPWDNAASPLVDNGLIYVNLNTASDNHTLAAFRLADGGLAWSGQNEGMTHTTPVIATIEGLRQVIYATQTGLVSLDCSTGNLLWKFTYPFFPISTSMGASPVVYSNLVYCTAGYARGAFALQVANTGSAWNVTQLWFNSQFNYQSIWMTPVCFEGNIYTLCGNNSSYLMPPLNCIDLFTGELKWSTNRFGMGGLILISTNLLVLTEDGQLVLARPSPDAYLELARYQAFQFSANSPGKCWNSPTYSNGRIYARSTTGAICLDVSVPPPPALKLLSPQLVSVSELELVIGTADGTPLDASRLAKIAVRAADQVESPQTMWSTLTNPLTLDPSTGLARMTVPISADQPRQFFAAVESP
jgi:outer membrane protein assembly factor BamB